MRRIILCADDFGKSLVISEAIVDLMAKQKLSATSCLVTAPNFKKSAQLLMPHLEKVDVGLHFDLTDNGKYNLLELILKARLNLLKRVAIESEINYQLDLFLENFKRFPDFIDGHQHIHQLPIIDDALLNVYHKRLRCFNPYLRWVKLDTNSVARSKQQTIKIFLDTEYRNKLASLAIPCNLSFAGIYRFSKKANYAQIFPMFLKNLFNRGLLMCHPGFKTMPTSSSVLDWCRHAEYQYLQSEKFVADCQAHGVTIVKWSEV